MIVWFVVVVVFVLVIGNGVGWVQIVGKDYDFCVGWDLGFVQIVQWKVWNVMYVEMCQLVFGLEFDVVGGIVGDEVLFIFEFVGGGLWIGGKDCLQWFQFVYLYLID